MYKVIFYAYDYKVIFKLIVFFAPNCEPSGSHILLLDTVQGGRPSLSTAASIQGRRGNIGAFRPNRSTCYQKTGPGHSCLKSTYQEKMERTNYKRAILGTENVSQVHNIF